MPAACAIAFFDVEGYTAFTAKHGDEAGLELADSLLDIAEELIHGAGGTIVKRLGDGLMVKFPVAERAMRCALGTQRALQARAALVDDAPVAAAKVAIHWGEPVERAGDLFGNDVNLTARLVDQCRGGQVLITEAMVAEIGPMVDELDLKRIGKVAGRGMGRDAPTAYRVRNLNDAPGATPIDLGETGIVATLHADLPGDDIAGFFMGVRALEAALNAVGARIIFTGVNVGDDEQPDLCSITVFPNQEAVEAFRDGPAGELTQVGIPGVFEPRVVSAYAPLTEYGVLFLDW